MKMKSDRFGSQSTERTNQTSEKKIRSAIAQKHGIAKRHNFTDSAIIGWNGKKKTGNCANMYYVYVRNTNNNVIQNVAARCARGAWINQREREKKRTTDSINISFLAAFLANKIVTRKDLAIKKICFSIPWPAPEIATETAENTEMVQLLPRTFAQKANKSARRTRDSESKALTYV